MASEPTYNTLCILQGLIRHLTNWANKLVNWFSKWLSPSCLSSAVNRKINPINSMLFITGVQIQKNAKLFTFLKVFYLLNSLSMHVSVNRGTIIFVVHFDCLMGPTYAITALISSVRVQKTGLPKGSSSTYSIQLTHTFLRWEFSNNQVCIQFRLSQKKRIQCSL